MPSAVFCIEYAVDKIGLIFPLVKTQHSTYRLYYARCRLGAEAEYDVMQALYRNTGAHYLHVGKQYVSVAFFEVASYFFAVLYFSLSICIERRFIRIQRFEFLEQVLTYVYFVEKHQRIAAHRRSLIEYGPI